MAMLARGWAAATSKLPGGSCRGCHLSSHRPSSCTPSSMTGSLFMRAHWEAPTGLAGDPGPSCQTALSGEALCSKELRSLRSVVVSSTMGSSGFSEEFSTQVVQPSSGN